MELEEPTYSHDDITTEYITAAETGPHDEEPPEEVSALNNEDIELLRLMHEKMTKPIAKRKRARVEVDTSGPIEVNEELDEAIRVFASRNRRFGKV